MNKTKLAQEQALNYLMADTRLYWQFSNRIKEEYFQDFPQIAGAIFRTYQDAKKPSLINIHPLVKEYYTFEELTNFFTKISYATDFEHWLDFLESERKRRLGIEIITGLDRICQSERTDEIEGYLHKKILSFSDSKSEDKSFRELISENIKHIERIQSGEKVFGIPTGINEFDNWTGGMQLTNLNIIAGYTSQGKTAAALTMAYYASTYANEDVAFFSLEMSNLEITARLLAIDTNISSKEILSGRVDLKELNNKLGNITNNKLHIAPKTASSLDYIMGMIRFYTVKYKCRIFFIDYLQQIENKKQINNELALAEICKTLKNFANENNVCVNLLCQLSRAEHKVNERPRLSKLRGSGQIEESADNVIFIYRPEKFDIHTIEFNDIEVATKGKTFFILDKSRNCGTNKWMMNFYEEIPTIENKHTKQYATQLTSTY